MKIYTPLGYATERMTMALNLYRRHHANCKAQHPDGFCSGQYDEQRKGWKRCDCAIYASGTLKGKFRRKSTGETDWEKAGRTAGAWSSWDGEAPPPATGSIPAGGRVLIADAVRNYRRHLEDTHALNTRRGYGYELDSLIEYSLYLGYVYLDQWQTGDVRAMRSAWGVIPSTARKKMGTVKSFFAYVTENEWLEKNPAAQVRSKKRTRQDRELDNAPRIPFTDAELTRMFSSCEHHATESQRRRKQNLSDFMALSLYTGLRISDVVTFNANRLDEDGNCCLRTTKTGVSVSTWIPAWLQERVRARAKEHGPLIFGAYNTEDLSISTNLWRRKLNDLWDTLGPWTTRPVHHRFRHTFARILLQKSVPVPLVADLLGDTEKMVRKHYAQWVSERQEYLTAVLRDAFTDKPAPRVLAFPG